jgi:hypothetical protein
VALLREVGDQVGVADHRLEHRALLIQIAGRIDLPIANCSGSSFGNAAAKFCGKPQEIHFHWP